MLATTFYSSNCHEKSAAVVIIQVGSCITGGYTDLVEPSLVLAF